MRYNSHLADATNIIVAKSNLADLLDVNTCEKIHQRDEAAIKALHDRAYPFQVMVDDSTWLMSITIFYNLDRENHFLPKAGHKAETYLYDTENKEMYRATESAVTECAYLSEYDDEQDYLDIVEMMEKHGDSRGEILGGEGFICIEYPCIERDMMLTYATKINNLTIEKSAYYVEDDYER